MSTSPSWFDPFAGSARTAQTDATPQPSPAKKAASAPARKSVPAKKAAPAKKSTPAKKSAPEPAKKSTPAKKSAPAPAKKAAPVNVAARMSPEPTPAALRRKAAAAALAPASPASSRQRTGSVAWGDDGGAPLLGLKFPLLAGALLGLMVGTVILLKDQFPGGPDSDPAAARTTIQSDAQASWVAQPSPSARTSLEELMAPHLGPSTAVFPAQEAQNSPYDSPTQQESESEQDLVDQINSNAVTQLHTEDVSETATPQATSASAGARASSAADDRPVDKGFGTTSAAAAPSAKPSQNAGTRSLGTTPAAGQRSPAELHARVGSTIWWPDGVAMAVGRLSTVPQFQDHLKHPWTQVVRAQVELYNGSGRPLDLVDFRFTSEQGTSLGSELHREPNQATIPVNGRLTVLIYLESRTGKAVGIRAQRTAVSEHGVFDYRT